MISTFLRYPFLRLIMVSRRVRKRKCKISSNGLRQGNSHKHKFVNYSHDRLHEHPYQTRSKSLREIKIDLIESLIPSRRPSDSSVVYLGLFHKNPQIITLEDSSESFPEKVIQPEVWVNTKRET
ncbi:uncharacterized protein LOC112552240 [Pogonomyrmex barbatus]|uniref:Uncharacterized protein LOC112552240 n=1 Tax=Pogonomyrmex barbatus TaxID=144034 RepID=A0A8N1S2M9_9HYME|nr:uncharacterized protein LOC112552240 [Pogonomyrmex barbatus]